MCLRPLPVAPIPEDTLRYGHLVMPADSILRVVGDQFASLVSDMDFADLYPPDGQPALSPALLAMVTVLQHQYRLGDRAAAAAVAMNIGWKYALHLPLGYAGFHYSVLSEFRDRLERHKAEARVFGKLLEELAELGLVKSRGRQRTDSFAVLSAVRTLNRLELVYETLRVALCALEGEDVCWLAANVPPQWADTYGELGRAEKLVRGEGEPRRKKVIALATRIGQDGLLLLERLDAAGAPGKLRELAEVATLRTVWAQQYVVEEGVLAWPEKVATPRAEVIQTPHDPDVRYTIKGEKAWEGSKVVVTETADEGMPHIITDVRTQRATDPDFGVAEQVQADLEAKGLLPEKHLVDAGFVSGEALAASAARDVELIGPARADSSAQSRIAEGITADQFVIDREKKQATCPAGAESVEWRERMDGGEKITHVAFDAARCRGCECYARCVMSKRKEGSGRSLTLRAHHELVEARRQEQKTKAFRQEYAPRAGIEGTGSEMIHAHGMRKARYVGLGKTHLQNLMIATATNLKRAARWLIGERPEGTRGPCLRGLAAAAAA